MALLEGRFLPVPHSAWVQHGLAGLGATKGSVVGALPPQPALSLQPLAR